jgi:uncharacterized damage-inducible protein DinB
MTDASPAVSATSQVRRLVAYNRWANERILDTAAEVAEAQLQHQLHPTMPALLPTLAHLLGTQVFWLRLWLGETIQRDPGFADLGALRAAYDANHDRLAAFAATLTDEALARRRKWWQQWGVESELDLSGTMLQVMHHSTQHRSEAAVMLTAFGHSPGDLDLLDYLASRSAGQE